MSFVDPEETATRLLRDVLSHLVTTSYGRRLNPKERELVVRLRKALAERTGKPPAARPVEKPQKRLERLSYKIR